LLAVDDIDAEREDLIARGVRSAKSSTVPADGCRARTRSAGLTRRTLRARTRSAGLTRRTPRSAIRTATGGCSRRSRRGSRAGSRRTDEDIAPNVRTPDRLPGGRIPIPPLRLRPMQGSRGRDSLA
jgi:hypothetical protein